MNKFIKYTVLTALSTSFMISAASASSLVGVQGTLKNIDKSVNVSVQQAEKLYEERRGKELDGAYNMLANTGNNPYLKTLDIRKDYKIVVRLSGTSPKDTGSAASVASPVAKALLGKSVVLIPVMAKGDEVITSWECLTNADADVQEFIGDAGAPENSRSYISSRTENKYLTNCIFVKNLSVFGIGDGKDDEGRN